MILLGSVHLLVKALMGTTLLLILLLEPDQSMLVNTFYLLRLPLSMYLLQLRIMVVQVVQVVQVMVVRAMPLRVTTAGINRRRSFATLFVELVKKHACERDQQHHKHRQVKLPCWPWEGVAFHTARLWPLICWWNQQR